MEHFDTDTKQFLAYIRTLDSTVVKQMLEKLEESDEKSKEGEEVC